MFRRACLLSAALSTLLTTGCAALSLFGQTHTHTHHHNEGCDSSAIVERLDNIETQISRLSAAGGSQVQQAGATGFAVPE